MSVKLHHFRIGLFVLSGAALLIGALFAVGLKAYFGKREIFETYVTGKVENLSVGALVTLRGVTIGKVRRRLERGASQYPANDRRGSRTGPSRARAGTRLSRRQYSSPGLCRSHAVPGRAGSLDSKTLLHSVGPKPIEPRPGVLGEKSAAGGGPRSGRSTGSSKNLD